MICGGTESDDKELTRVPCSALLGFWPAAYHPSLSIPLNTYRRKYADK
jgi:hypothetical protein